MNSQHQDHAGEGQTSLLRTLLDEMRHLLHPFGGSDHHGDDHPGSATKDTRTTFRDWSGYTVVKDLEIHFPTSTDDVVILCNQAAAAGKRIRPVGHSHNWSPLVVSKPTSADEPAQVLVDTRGLTTRSATVVGGLLHATFGTGTTLEDATAFMAAQTSPDAPHGYGFLNMPTPGGLTLGGILAVGGHGTSVPGGSVSEPDLMGCFSNLVVSFTAVVSDESKPGTYTPHTFHRSDEDAAAFLVHLGRAFITEVTLAAVPNFTLQLTNVFAPMAQIMEPASAAPSSNALSSLLDRHGRIEVIWFPGPDSPNAWVQCCTRYDGSPPVPNGTEVPGPYNYGWMNWISQGESDVARELFKLLPSITDRAMQAEYLDAEANMASAVMNGQARDLQLYLTDNTLRMTAFGYVLQIPRQQVQAVANEYFKAVQGLLTEYATNGQHPVNGAVEIRCTTVDRQDDLGLNDARPPALAASHAVNAEVDTVLWLDVLTFPGTPSAEQFFVDLENWMWKTWGARYPGQLRPEWSKGWAYTTAGPWTNAKIIRSLVPTSYDRADDGLTFSWAKQTLARYDRSGIFTNEFLAQLFA